MNRETLELMRREAHRIKKAFETLCQVIDDECKQLEPPARQQSQQQQAKAN